VSQTRLKQEGAAPSGGHMLDEQGELEKHFTADAAVIAAETQGVTLAWPWPDPRLWDVGQPHLYTLRLRVQGPGLDDEVTQRFGFREFWVEGRQFYLNGSVIHLRQPCFTHGPRMQAGDLFSEMGEGSIDARGDDADSGRGLDDADRKGYLIAQYILNANNHRIQQLFRTGTWRSWRTAGLPGGLRTWSWMQDSLQEINGPTLAWIAGQAGAYTAKDHHFSPGQKIAKQIVLINDTRQSQNFTAAWTAALGGREVDRGQIQGSLAVSDLWRIIGRLLEGAGYRRCRGYRLPSGRRRGPASRPVAVPAAGLCGGARR
jgi:hypothetical protein